MNKSQPAKYDAETLAFCHRVVTADGSNYDQDYCQRLMAKIDSADVNNFVPTNWANYLCYPVRCAWPLLDIRQKLVAYLIAEDQYDRALG